MKVLLQILALLMLPWLSGCADAVLLHPPPMASKPPGATARLIPFCTGNLEVWTRRANPAREPSVFVLEFCGNATRAEDVVLDTATRWRGVNAEDWSVNYPGYGGSTGPANLRAIPPAALAAYDALHQVAGDRPIFVVGRSIGTAVALHVASQRPVAGVLLHSPTPLPRVILGSFGWWNLWIAASIIAAQVPPEMNALHTAPRCAAPAVFLVTERDELVRPKFQREVIADYAGPKQVIELPTATHNTPVSEAEEERIAKAIRRLIAP